MYGPPYAAPSPQTPQPGARPTMLLAGVVAMFVTVTACLAETAFEVLLAKSFSTFAESNGGEQVGDAMQPYLIMTIVANAFIAIALGTGSLLTVRRTNAGRIVNWVAGGVCVLVRLCCLSGLGMFGLVKNAVANDPSSSDIGLDQMAPTWQVAGAAICSTIALIAVLAGIVLISVRTVNLWFRDTPTAPAAPGYPYPPYRGY